MKIRWSEIKNFYINKQKTDSLRRNEKDASIVRQILKIILILYALISVKELSTQYLAYSSNDTSVNRVTIEDLPNEEEINFPIDSIPLQIDQEKLAKILKYVEKRRNKTADLQSIFAPYNTTYPLPRSYRGLQGFEHIESKRIPEIEGYIRNIIESKYPYAPFIIDQIIIAENPFKIERLPKSENSQLNHGNNADAWIQAAYDGSYNDGKIYIFIPSNIESILDTPYPPQFNPLMGGAVAENMTYREMIEFVFAHELAHGIEDFFLKGTLSEEEYKEAELPHNRNRGYNNPVIQTFGNRMGYVQNTRNEQFRNGINVRRNNIRYVIYPQEPNNMIIEYEYKGKLLTIERPREGLIPPELKYFKDLTDPNKRILETLGPRTTFGAIPESFADFFAYATIHYNLDNNKRVTEEIINSILDIQNWLKSLAKN
ncbi:MAG: hypothetical protein KatS3mg090_0339 [Patescibacteria group bacterium]|nr:MAG: hypothetical protein KatS3mg090_0339 [Patescibacteria group bacterium]